jgi:hypothetical protein
MYRCIYRAQLKEGLEDEGIKLIQQRAEAARKDLESNEIMVMTGHKWKRSVFLYIECLNEPFHPDRWFAGMEQVFENWPGHDEYRSWIPMIDVFHFNRPVSPEHWRRKEPVERRVGRVAHLLPEMAASYIYYHYQLQEEHAFFGPKYEIIAMHENLLFGYQEFPAVVEEPLAPRGLQTSGTPENWADSKMNLHFQAWPDGHLYFKPVETLFEIY